MPYFAYLVSEGPPSMILLRWAFAASCIPTPIVQMTLIFLGIVYLHDGIKDVLFLTLGRLVQYLLGGDLDVSLGAILDPCLILRRHDIAY